MSLEWLPAVTAPAAAVLGAAAGYRLSRPKLSFSVDRVSISASRVASTFPVAVDETLKGLVRSFPIGLPRIDLPTAPERVYVTYLEILRQQLDDEERVLDEQGAVADQLRELASKEEFERMVELYLPHHRNIWSWALGEFRRGQRVFSSRTWSPPADDASTAHEIDLIETDEYAGFQVRFPGVMQCFFEWDFKGVAPARVIAGKDFAHRVSTAVATHRRTDLMEYFGAIRDTVVTAGRRLHEIRSRVLQLLSKYARLNVEVLISNHGRTGTSVSPEIDCQLQLKGYTSGAVRIDTDPIIRLEGMSQVAADAIKRVVAEEKAEDLRVDELSPILIPSGETIRVIGTSETPVDVHAQADSIRAAYSGAERTFRLTVTEFHQRAFSATPVRRRRLRKVLFRDLAVVRRASSTGGQASKFDSN